MKKAVILARVSTKRQEEEGLSLKEIQLPVLRNYAKDHGFTVADKDEFVFQESADRKIRKKFDEMIGYVKKSKDISAIITYRVDRITRNYRDAVAMDDIRLEHGKELHFVNDRLVITKDSTGRDIQDWDLKVFLAKQTINRLKDDERISRKRKLNNGELPGPAPFGYKNVTLENKKKWILPHEFKSIIVKKMFEWYASENYSLLEISRKLRKEYKINKSRSMVHFTLKNRFYIGFITNENKEYPHRYDQFITKKLFDKAQSVIDKRSGSKKRFKYASKEYAYSGLLRCHQCGCMITPDPKKRKLANGSYNFHMYYHCTNYHKKHDTVKSVDEPIIDKQFAKLFDNLKLPEKNLNEITTSLKQAHQDKNSFFEKEFRYLNSQINRFKKRIDTAYLDRLDGCITKDRFEEIRKESEQHQADLREKITNLDEAEKEYYLTTSRLVELGSRTADMYSRSKPHEKRALINFVLSNRELDGEKLLYTAKFPFNVVLKYAPHSNWLPG